jgi:hypothetical protein
VLAAGCGITTVPPEPDAGADAAAGVDAWVAPLDASVVDVGIDAPVDAAPLCVASPEICNGRDDDCDGVLDDEPEASAWCGARCGLDVCPRARPIAPLTGELLTTQRPTFRWALEGDADAARVEICRDRACAMTVTTFTGVTSAAPIADLPRGVLFWRLVPTRAGSDLPAVSTPWIARIPNVSRLTDTSTGSVLDFDGDARADLLVTRYVGSAMTPELILVAGTPAGLVPRAVLPSSVVVLLASSDFDGDGRADALTMERGGAVVLRMGASGLLGAPRPAPAALVTTGAIVAGDVDADGYPDLLDAPQRLVRGGPDGLWSDAVDLATPPYAAPSYDSATYAVGDLDADGIADVVAAQSCFDAGLGAPWCPTDRALWRTRGGSTLGAPDRWTGAPLGGAFPGGERDTAGPIVAAGDLDGDGRNDLVATFVTSDAVTIFDPSGGSQLSPLLLLERDAVPDHEAWTSLDAAELVSWLGPGCDLDGDGAGELVLGRASSGATGSARTFLRRGGPDGPRAEEIALSDLVARETRCLGDDDGDGFSEIAVLFYDPLPGAEYHCSMHVYRGAAGGIDPTPVQVIDAGNSAHF